MNTIVIATTPGREGWLSQCLKSIGDRRVVVLSDYSFELGKIRWMFENTCCDRWMLLQDSVVIKDQSFFDKAFAYPKSVAVSTCPTKFGMYLGIYHRDTLAAIGIPEISTKEEAIYHEMHWSNKYCRAEDVPVMFTNFTDHNNKGVVNLFDRPNLVLENEYLIKYKGTWSSHVRADVNPRLKKV